MLTLGTKKFGHLEQEILDNIINIHSERGKRIVGYLNTAHQLLEIRAELISMNFNLPKLPETIAYCIREALTEPLEGARNIDQLLEQTSRVIDAKNEYLSKGEPSESQRKVGLRKVWKAIDGLKTAEEEISSTNKLRVTKLLKEMELQRRPHQQQEPHPSYVAKFPREEELQPKNSVKVIQNYVDLIKQVQKGVHERTSGEEVEEMWAKCLDIHKEIYYSERSKTVTPNIRY